MLGVGISPPLLMNQQSIPRRVRSILNKYGATMLLPGVAEPILGPELNTAPNNNGFFINPGATGLTTDGTATKTTGWVPVVGGKTYIFSTTGDGNRRRVQGLNASGVERYVTEISADATPNGVYQIPVDIVSIRVYYSSAVASATALSVREILGYNHTRYSYQAGNYRESTGQTLAAADQQIGLVVDAARVPGPELVPVLDFTTWAATAAVTGRTANSFTTNAIGGVVYSIPSGSGKTYEVTISGTTTATLVVRNSSNSNGQYVISAGTFSTTIKSPAMHETNGQLYLALQTAGTLSDVMLSIRELPGIHATQSTSGFQPVLRRGLVNLFTESDFRNGVTDASVRGGLVSASTMAGYSGAIAFGYDGATSLTFAYKGTFSAVQGTTYTLAAVVQMDDGLAPVFGSATPNNVGNPFAIVIGGAVAAPTSISVTHIGGTDYMVLLTTQAGSVATSNGIIKYLANNTRTFKATRYALFQGTVTAEEIIAAGGIPVTTTAPASSANGIQSWQFDGTDDRLSLSAVPFQMADDHFVIGGATVANFSVLRALFGAYSSSQNNPRMQIYCAQTTGACIVQLRGDSGASAIPSAGNATANQPFVFGWEKQGSVVRALFDNAVSANASTASVGTLTVDVAAIGETKSAFHNGMIHGLIVGKGAISASERQTLVKFMAQLQGRQL